MARIRTNNVFGTTTDNPLIAGAVTMNSAGLANLAVVAGSDEALITLDPNRVNGAPEIVRVTAHTGSATSATIVRGAFGTAARSHPLGTEWEHAPVAGPRPAAGTVGDFIAADPPACRVFHNANQSINDVTVTTVAFNSERFDTDTMHDTVTNNSRITFTTAGLYLVTFNGGFAAAGDYSSALAQIRLNGVTGIAEVFAGTQADANENYFITISTVYKFAVADYVEARVWQNNTANVARNLVALGNISPEFSAVRLGSGD
jgi:hypothetical protein